MLIMDFLLNRWICPYLPDSKRDILTELIESDSFQIVYDEYNWLINIM